ncbi:MAG TPA: mechanosensitive ion channel family protein [Steroidobacteraceae bacterium]|nr:mechanosensitive ion channel family protein [Steroidobacteraceae bacterium]
MNRAFSYLDLAPGGILLGNPLSDWAYALGLGLATFLILVFLRRQLAQRARRFAGMELPQGVRLLLALLRRTQPFVLFAVSLLVGSKYLDLGTRAERVTTLVIVILVALQIGVWLSAAVRFYLEAQSAHATDRSAQTMVTIVRFVADLVIWSLVLLVALDNLGVQVKALLTGLGIGGIAVALAVQNVFGDLLASISIALDKPFAVGDALTLDQGYSGTVEAIGIKSTRLRSATGEQIILPNAELVRVRIRNFGRLAEWRSVFRLGIVCGTPAARLAEIPGIVRAAVTAQAAARFERAHFVGFSATALDFEVSYVVASADYGKYLDTQQAVNLALAAEFERRGIAFAAPVQAVTIVREAAAAPSVR